MAKNRLGKFFTEKKYRPWLIGGVVIIGAIILLALLGKGSGGNAAGGASASGPSEALQAKMIDAQLQGASIQASLQAAGMQAQADVATAQLAADIQARQIDASLIAAQQQTQADVYATELAAQVQQAQIASNEAIQVSALQEATNREAIYAQQSVQQATILAEAQKFFAKQSAATQQAYIAADVAKDQIAAATQIAQYDAYVQVQTGQQALMADAIARAKKKHIPAILAGESPQLGTKTNAILGGVLSLGGILSDVRAKEEIKWSGVQDGYNWYEYREKKLIGKGKKKVGVMAQEMPQQYVVDMGRFYGVNYALLNREADLYQEGMM